MLCKVINYNCKKYALLDLIGLDNATYHLKILKINMNHIKASFYEPSRIKGRKPEYFRQTDYSKGQYKNIKYGLNNLNAEWQIIGTWVKDISKIKHKKIIYLQQEPPECRFPHSSLLDNVTCVISPFRMDHPVKQYISYTPIQWTYDLNVKFCPENGHIIEPANDHDIIKMKNLKFPKKERICSIVTSTKSFLPGHIKRIRFLENIADHFKNKIDFFGHGFNPINNKKEAIDPYIFSIGIENSSYYNYWTEKIADIYLGYSCPIYYGCKNINDFFNKNTMINIDIENLDQSIFILENILNNPLKYKPNYADIIVERKKVLQEYNFFKVLTEVINHNKSL